MPPKMPKKSAIIINNGNIIIAAKILGKIKNEIGSNDMLTKYSEVHESEYRWINTQFDNIIDNDSSIEELGYIVALLMHR